MHNGGINIVGAATTSAPIVSPVPLAKLLLTPFIYFKYLLLQE